MSCRRCHWDMICMLCQCCCRCVLCRSVSKSFKIAVEFKTKARKWVKTLVTLTATEWLQFGSTKPKKMIVPKLNHSPFFSQHKVPFLCYSSRISISLLNWNTTFQHTSIQWTVLWTLSISAFHVLCVTGTGNLPVEEHTLFLSLPLERNRWGLDQMKEIRDEGISLKMETEREDEQ